MHLEGKGAPTVVIDAGITDQLDKLRPLQERVAQVTHVITYNRAGYGQSEPGPMPRHSGREAEELKALLEKATVPGPYVLVGHSLGALNMQVFASKYPDKVAGMVLLDPPPLSFILGQEYKDLGVMAERMTAEWQAIADSTVKSPDAREQARSSFFQMIASEHREMFGEFQRLGICLSWCSPRGSPILLSERWPKSTKGTGSGKVAHWPTGPQTASSYSQKGPRIIYIWMSRNS
jgi:pimeloyl-ACP methyl ester carboxylesterase